MKQQELARVLLTLAYSDQFYFPLTTTEVWRRVVSVSKEERVLSEEVLQKEDLQKIGLSQIEAALRELKKRAMVEFEDGYWFLKRGQADLELRLAREKLAQARWSEVEWVKQLISWLPWIKGIAVTGSLAVENLQAKGDLDFMVVAARRRLWLSRLVVGFLSWLAGKRRTWQGDGTQNWCFNLWLAEDKLELPKSKRGLYEAYEVCQVKFIYEVAGVRKKFYQNNRWVEQWLPNYFSFLKEEARKEGGEWLKVKGEQGVLSGLLSLFGWIFKGVLGVVEQVAFMGQHLYMYPHMSRELVGRGFAFFHPRQTKSLIYRRLAYGLWRGRGKSKLVLVTGVFDLLHQEHLNFLVKAKQAGAWLVVGVEPDCRVKELKGCGRPIQGEKLRQQNLQSLSMVDQAFILPTNFSQESARLSWLKELQPDILAVSSHSPYLTEKKKMMGQVGGVVRVVHQHNPAVSTTQFLSRKFRV